MLELSALIEQVARTWGVMTAALPKGASSRPWTATALHHGLVLARRNLEDLRHFNGLALENPWH